MEPQQAKKSHAQQLVETREGAELPDLLRSLFVSQRMTKGAIAERLGVSRATVTRWIEDFGVDPRKAMEAA